MSGVRETDAISIEHSKRSRIRDTIALEQPLSMKIKHQDEINSLGLTMRTPVSDDALIHGFLYSEGIIDSIEDVTDVEYDPEQIVVTLDSNRDFDTQSHTRHTPITSACGVCGKESLSHLLHHQDCRPNHNFKFHENGLQKCSQQLRESQKLFQLSGGTHAAAAFDKDGVLVCIEEDIGRHNAMDKLVGRMMLEDIEISDHLVLVSGRSSFELVQKAIRGGFPILASVGAASSLAVDLARENDLTLVSFVKDDRLVIHSSPHRILS